MSIAAFALAEGAIAQGNATSSSGTKAPPRRKSVALADANVTPEPR